MPSPKVSCPVCGNPKGAKASLCADCGKGKYERTPEARRRMSESTIAAWTPERREAARLRGLAIWTPEMREAAKKNAAAWTPERRRKASELRTGVKRPEVGKKIAAAWTPEMREVARLRGLALADDPAWRAKIGRAGEANHNYQGKDASPYGSGFSPGMKKRLIAKRGGMCESCGVAGSGPTGRLDVHHRDFAKTDHSEANLGVVCHACHMALHKAQRGRH